jgi:hypothetical protein
MYGEKSYQHSRKNRMFYPATDRTRPCSARWPSSPMIKAQHSCSVFLLASDPANRSAVVGRSLR